MDVDPLASMRCWAITLELGGREFEIPALPAIEWWPVLVSGEIADILDFIASTPDDPANVDELLLSGLVTGEELTEALVDVIEEVAGRSLHATLVLSRIATSQWPVVGGVLAQTAFRWDQQPLGAALDAIHEILASRLDEEHLKAFRSLLDNDVAKTPARRAQDREKAASEFEAMAGPRPTGGVVATGEPSGSGPPRTPPRSRPRRQGGPSPSPRQRHGPRAGSGPEASSVSPEGADVPASGTGPPLPLSER